MTKNQAKGSGWTIYLAIEQNININWLQIYWLGKELNHSRKGLISVQNTDDNECFKKWSVKYLNPADHHLQELETLTKVLQENMIIRAKCLYSKNREKLV